MAKKDEWVEVPLGEESDWKEVSADYDPEKDSSGALGVVSDALKAIDAVTGAPTRSAISSAIEMKNPLAAFTSQFAEDPEKAPTGEYIAKQIGVPEKDIGSFTGKEAIKKIAEYGGPVGSGLSLGLQAVLPEEVKEKTYKPTTTDVAGFGIDLLADPTNLLSFGGAKSLSKMGGVASEGAEKIGSAARSFVKSKQAQKAESVAEAASKVGAEISARGTTVEQGGSLFSIKRPESLEELRGWSPSSGDGEMIGKTRLKEIEVSVPDLETKPLKYHYSMMENPKSMKELKLRFENLPTEDAKKIASYNQEMVNESARKVEDTVRSISGKQPVELGDAGEGLISTVKEKYKAEKTALGPVFNKIKSESRNLTKNEAQDLIQAIGENSKVGGLLSQDLDTGKFVLSKNAPRSGISDAEHGVISRVVDDLNDGMTFEELQKTREFLRKSVDPANRAASEEVSKIRSILLGQMEHIAGARGQDIGGAFKAYAKNERARESIEHIIGGKIESLDSMYAANPDKVVQKIFSNPNYVSVVAEYAGDDAVKNMVASYINKGVKKSFDPAKGFNPSELRNWLKSNKTFLSNYVDPEISTRLNALADYGYYGKRFLDEVNPSGTAASLIEAIKPEGFIQKVKTGDITGAITGEISQRVSSKLKQRQAVAAFDEAISGIKRTDVPRGGGFLAGLEKRASDVANIAGVVSTARAVNNQLIQQDADVATVMQTMHPYDREQYIKKDNSLTPTQKAVLLKQNRNAR